MKVVGSNSRTVYWMDIFSHIVKIVMFVSKDENKNLTVKISQLI